jgi:hypothetical protein
MENNGRTKFIQRVRERGENEGIEGGDIEIN